MRKFREIKTCLQTIEKRSYVPEIKRLNPKNIHLCFPFALILITVVNERRDGSVWRSGNALNSYSDVLCSNIGRNTYYPDVLRCFPKSLQANAGIVP